MTLLHVYIPILKVTKYCPLKLKSHTGLGHDHVAQVMS